MFARTNFIPPPEKSPGPPQPKKSGYAPDCKLVLGRENVTSLAGEEPELEGGGGAH